MNTEQLTKPLLLANKAIEYLANKIPYSSKSIAHFKTDANQIVRLMIKNNITELNGKIVVKLTGLIKKNTNFHSQRTMLYRLWEFYQTGQITRIKKFKKRPILPFSGPIGKHINDFISEAIENKRANSTIRGYRNALKPFYDYSIENKICKYDYPLVIRFLNEKKFPNPTQACNCIRALLPFTKYLFEQKVIDRDFSSRIPRFKYPASNKLPSVYTEEEIKRVLTKIDRGTPAGIRNYALLLMAAKLGIRQGDLVNLEFKNIDWRKEIIGFVQEKTGKYLELPLMKCIQQALIDYLQNSRPKSLESHIFLSVKAPFLKMNSAGVTHVFTRALGRSEIQTGERSQGARALRSSLATTLLNNNTPYSIISGVLGHEASNMARKHYISIDMNALKKCVHEIAPVDENFYLQNAHVL